MMESKKHRIQEAWLVVVYAEQEGSGRLRRLGECWTDSNLRAMELYQDECRDDERIAVKRIAEERAGQK